MSNQSHLSALFDITAQSERHYAPNLNLDDNVQRAIDELKEDFYHNRYNLPYAVDDISDQDIPYYTQMKHFYIRDLSIKEMTPYYRKNIKTGYTQTLIDTLIDGVFDGTVIETIGTEEFTAEDAEELAFNLMAHGRVLVTKKLGQYYIIPPYRYFIRDNGSAVVYHYAIDSEPLKEIFDANVCTTYKGMNAVPKENPIDAEFFELTTRAIVTDGMLELSMLRSALLTLLQSDLWGGSTVNFIDEQYLNEDRKLDSARVNYVPTQTVENMNAEGKGAKPLFETITPEVRSSEFQSLLSVVDDTMATLAGVTQEVIGSQNATESNQLSAKTAKRFNKLKVIFQQGINNMYQHFGIEKRINLSRYRADSDEMIIKNAVLIAGSNIGTVRQSLVKLYPDLSDDEIDILYLKGELKSNRQLTADEIIRAKELEIYIEQTFDSQSSERKTESEINASELTPGQGVLNNTGE